MLLNPKTNEPILTLAQLNQVAQKLPSPKDFAGDHLRAKFEVDGRPVFAVFHKVPLRDSKKPTLYIMKRGDPSGAGEDVSLETVWVFQGGIAI